MIRTPLLLPLILLCPLAAQAQETWDLRAASEEQNAVGDKVTHVESEQQDMTLVIRQGQDEVQREQQVQGFEQRYVEELLAVDEEGEVTSARRTYTVFTDKQTKQTLEGGELVVTWTREASGTRKVDYPQDRALPDALKEKLEHLAAGEPEEESEGPKPEQNPGKLFTPAEPVAVGATWPVDPKQAMVGMGIDEALDAEGSSCTGTLVAATAEGEVTWLDVKVTMTLRLTTLEGVQCTEPFVFALTMDLRLPAGGGNVGNVVMNGTMKGALAPPDAPPGVTFSIDMTMTGDLRRTPATETE